MPTTYEVIVRRDGRFWYLEIPALDGATQARNLGEVEEMARDYIATVLDVPESTVAVEVAIALPDDVQAHLRHAEDLREQEARARAEAAKEVRVAARQLKDAGYTVRDIGAALKVSHQRAQQLVTVRSVEINPGAATDLAVHRESPRRMSSV